MKSHGEILERFKEAEENERAFPDDKCWFYWRQALAWVLQVKK